MTPRSGRPPLILPHFTRSILTRSLLVWVVTRGVATAASAAVAGEVGIEPADPLRIPLLAVLLVLALVAGAGWVEARRRNEDTFLLCLGYGRARQMATIVGPFAVVELLILLVG